MAWFRKFPGDGAILQCAGVGGTTLHYTECYPRAYPASIDEQGHWPIDYDELVPYYREVEEMCDVAPASVTAKEVPTTDSDCCDSVPPESHSL